MDRKIKPLPLSIIIMMWTALAAFVVVVGYGIILIQDIFHSMKGKPTYAQVCAPLAFIRKADYYNDRTFVVCGSPTTEPVLKEYPRQ